MMLFGFILILLCNKDVRSKDLVTVNFIKSFVIKEHKPTYLVCYGLCWKKNQNLNLLKELSNGGIRSIFSTHTSTYQEHETMFLIDLDCPWSEELFSNDSASNLFAFPYRWLVLNSLEDKSNILSDVPLSPGSDFVLASRENDTFTLHELHKTSSIGEVISNRRGYYNGTFFDIRPHKELFRRRQNIMGHPLTMANVIQDSNSTQYHLEDRLEAQHDSTAKISWMVVKLAFQMLNATPRYILSHRWGYKQNGTWSGMIDDILHNRADLGTNCAVYTERLDVIQYTDTIAPFKVGFIFRQPPLSYVTNIFSLPFSTEVWLASIGCVVFSIITLYFASKWEVRLQRTPSQLDGTVSDAMLVTISAFSQQGCTLEPRKASGRMMLWVIFTALMALYAAYSANIVVLLQAPSSAIRTLTQLSQSKLTLAANDVDYNHFVFGMYSDAIRVKITNRVKPLKGKAHFYEIKEGVERIRQGLFAFHSIVEPVYRRVEQTFLEMEKCDLVEVDFMMGFNPFVPVKKDSPYLELLKVSFKRIRESGLQSAINKRLQVPKPKCTHRISAFNSVGILDLWPVLALMLYGTAVSLVILLIEMMTFKMYVVI
ncbi:unnamed protein product [Parnassius mnemosyne]|uniref:Ionotropic glutamate receptor C-terminal domain-containing protein n=1 Tax=Parnassius mnemosyne TaxID=213953 RepID=A0AAV1KP20_9NEOP